MNGYTSTPHHRQNRRRERPGSRARRSLTRKSTLHNELVDGIIEARDPELLMPSDSVWAATHVPVHSTINMQMYKPRTSPLLRQNFDQNWARWKARERAEEERMLKIARNMAKEQRRVFGGEEEDTESEEWDGDGEVDLCPRMLEVVISLWGDVDYTDP